MSQTGIPGNGPLSTVSSYGAVLNSPLCDSTSAYSVPGVRILVTACSSSVPGLAEMALI